MSDQRERYWRTYAAGIVDIVEAWRNGDLNGEEAMIAIRDHIEPQPDPDAPLGPGPWDPDTGAEWHDGENPAEKKA